MQPYPEKKSFLKCVASLVPLLLVSLLIISYAMGYGVLKGYSEALGVPVEIYGLMDFHQIIALGWFVLITQIFSLLLTTKALHCMVAFFFVSVILRVLSKYPKKTPIANQWFEGLPTFLKEATIALISIGFVFIALFYILLMTLILTAIFFYGGEHVGKNFAKSQVEQLAEANNIKHCAIIKTSGDTVHAVVLKSPSGSVMYFDGKSVNIIPLSKAVIQYPPTLKSYCKPLGL